MVYCTLVNTEYALSPHKPATHDNGTSETCPILLFDFLGARWMFTCTYNKFSVVLLKTRFDIKNGFRNLTMVYSKLAS
jgi:hypothetical protein